MLSEDDFLEDVALDEAERRVAHIARHRRAGTAAWRPLRRQQPQTSHPVHALRSVDRL